MISYVFQKNISDTHMLQFIMADLYSLLCVQFIGGLIGFIIGTIKLFS
ncbi:MAG: hypothetical protein WA432_04755 [Candidatus Babeliaceae bacterium]